MWLLLFLVTSVAAAAPPGGAPEPHGYLAKQSSVSSPRKVAEIGYSPSISGDGRYLAYADGIDEGGGMMDEAFVRNLATGQVSQLTFWKDGGEIGDVLISQDGRSIVYDWDGGGGRQLMTRAIPEGPPRLVYHHPEVRRMTLLDWSSDGRYLAMMEIRRDGTSRLGILKVADGSFRVLQLFPKVQWRCWARFSPDSGHLAFDASVVEGAVRRDLVIADLAIWQQKTVAQEGTFESLLDWSPDGRVLFSRGSEGHAELWAIGPEAAPGGPVLLACSFPAIEGAVGITADGSLFTAREGWRNEMYIMSLDKGGGIGAQPLMAVTNLAYESSAAWSPDGSAVAFVTSDGSEAAPLALGIRRSDGTEDRVEARGLSRFGSHGLYPGWSPDGRLVLLQGRHHEFEEGGDSEGIYAIDLAAATARPLLRTLAVCPPDCLEWSVWAPDGRVLYVRWLPSFRRTIMALDPARSEENEVYQTPEGEISHLAVSPDGSWIAFLWAHTEGRQAALRVIEATGGEARTLVEFRWPKPTSYGQAIFALAWTPDSSSLFYAPTAEKAPQQVELWRIGIDRDARPEPLGVVLVGLLPFGLSVHPNGDRIAVTAGTLPRTEVWEIPQFIQLVSPSLSRVSAPLGLLTGLSHRSCPLVGGRLEGVGREVGVDLGGAARAGGGSNLQEGNRR